MNRGEQIRAELAEQMRQRILLLDGAMGTMIQARKLTEADYRGREFAGHAKDLRLNNEVLNLSQPQIIEEVHRAYLAAGADIIETNTFNGNAISMAEYGLQSRAADLSRAGAQIARRAVDRYAAETGRRCYVAGSMGPTSRTASVSQDVSNPAARTVTFDQLREAYAAQAQALVEGGVDVLLLETIFDTLNAKAALFAIEEYFEKSGARIPVIVSVTIVDRSGRNLFRTNRRSVLDFRLAHAAAGRGHELRAGRQADAPVHRGAFASGADSHHLLPERRVAQRVRRIRRDAGAHGRRPGRIRAQRLAEYRRRLLRLDAGAHSRHRRSVARRCAACAGKARAVFALQRPRSAGHPSGHQLREHRRAHQRHRLAEISPN